MPRPRSEQKTARRAGDGMAEINRSLVDLFTEQARHNVQLFQALAQPTNWGKAPSSRASSCAPASSGQLSSPGAMSRSARP